MKNNTDVSFVGLEELKRGQADQLSDFISWAASGRWDEFHRYHYDWWMFPFDKSSSYGEAYTVYEYEVNELKKDKLFIRNYLRGVELLMLSWGWVLDKRCEVDHPATEQHWANWPIRLYKCGMSLLLFGYYDVFESVRVYAQLLIKEGYDFWYDGEDLSELFRSKILYVHGLSSSGHSGTASNLRKLLPEVVVYSPDLPADPEEALSLLLEIARKKRVDIVIGTSMGGMFAQKLRGYRKILVNPSFHVSQSMRQLIGVNYYFSPREDGRTEYEITEKLCDAYQKMEAGQFDNLNEYERSNTIGLFGTEDTTVNCRAEFLKYYLYGNVFPGGHRLREDSIRDYILPLLTFER